MKVFCRLVAMTAMLVCILGIAGCGCKHENIVTENEDYDFEAMEYQSVEKCSDCGEVLSKTERHLDSLICNRSFVCTTTEFKDILNRKLQEGGSPLKAEFMRKSSDIWKVNKKSDGALVFLNASAGNQYSYLTIWFREDSHALGFNDLPDASFSQLFIEITLDDGVMKDSDQDLEMDALAMTLTACDPSLKAEDALELVADALANRNIGTAEKNNITYAVDSTNLSYGHIALRVWGN